MSLIEDIDKFDGCWFLKFILAKYDWNVNCIDEYGKAPIHVACNLKNYNEVVRLLIRHGANVNVADANKYTPLHISTLLQKHDLTELLLENDANPDVIDKFGCSPIMNACMHDDVELTKMLINYGAHVDLPKLMKIASSNESSQMISYLENYSQEYNT